MSKIIILGIVLIGAAVVAQKTIELPVARLTLRAIDEERNPISGAAVKMSFEKAMPSWGGGDPVPVTGLTDQEGRFTGEGHSFDTKGGIIRKQGYYTSSPESYKFKDAVLGKWQPWNPTLTVTLKRIAKPIPMYARQMTLEIPQTAKSIGFDLQASDWVAPYGKGTQSDFVFELNKKGNSFDNFSAELSLVFDNKADGIQIIPSDGSGSELKSPHLAPEEGYQSSLSWSRGNSPQKGEYGMEVPSTNYFFRVRAQLNESGKVIAGLYGKIYGGIEFFPASYKTAKIRFIYYLNPTELDKNIEFDVHKNLFLNLKSDERVDAP